MLLRLQYRKDLNVSTDHKYPCRNPRNQRQAKTVEVVTLETEIEDDESHYYLEKGKPRLD